MSDFACHERGLLSLGVDFRGHKHTCTMRSVCAIKVIILRVMAAAAPRHSANNELLSTRNLMNENHMVRLAQQCRRGFASATILCFF